MLNESIKEYYKGKLFEEILIEAPIRYNMPEPDIFGLFGRAIKYLALSDLPAWMKYFLAQSQGLTNTFVRGQRIRKWNVGKIIRISDKNDGVFALPDGDTGVWYWLFRDKDGNILPPMRAPKSWDPNNPYDMPAEIWEQLPSSVREELMKRFLIIPGLGGVGQELIDPETEGEFDPDNVVPDFDPNNVYAGMGDNPNPKGQGV